MTKYAPLWSIISFSDSSNILDLPGGANVLAPNFVDLQRADILQCFYTQNGVFIDYPIFGKNFPNIFVKSWLQRLPNDFSCHSLFVQFNTTNKGNSVEKYLLLPHTDFSLFKEKRKIVGEPQLRGRISQNPYNVQVLVLTNNLIFTSVNIFSPQKYITVK